MTRRLEIVDTDNPNIRLTVTKERVTIKVPTGTPKDDADKVIAFFKKVADKIPNPEKAVRGGDAVGKILKYGVSMGTQSTKGGGKNKHVERTKFADFPYEA